MGSAFALGLFFWFLTGNVLALNISIACFIIIPNAVVGIIDLYLRIQFSLLALLLAISTLQIPILVFINIRTNLGIGLGIALLSIWVFVVGWNIKKQLDKQKPEPLPIEAKTE